MSTTTRKRSTKKKPEISIPTLKELTARVEELEEAKVDDLLACDDPIEIELKSIGKKVTIVFPKYKTFGLASVTHEDPWEINLEMISLCLVKPKMTFKQLDNLRADVGIELVKIFNKLSGITEEDLDKTRNLPEEKDSSSGK